MSARKARKTTEKRVDNDAVEVEKVEASEKKSGNRKYFWILFIVIVFGLLYVYRGLFVVAMVNGKPVTRLALIRELENQTGKQVLDGIITEKLIYEEGSKRGIVVLPKDIDSEIEKLRQDFSSQGGNLDDELASRGMSESTLRKQMEVQLIIERMFKDEINVTDEDVDKYIEDNKDYYSYITDEQQLKETVKKDIEQSQLAEKFQDWLSKSRQEAKIDYLVNY